MISKNDVINVARSINKALTDDQIEMVIEEYPMWVEQDPAANWRLLVEDIINFIASDIV